MHYQYFMKSKYRTESTLYLVIDLTLSSLKSVCFVVVVLASFDLRQPKSLSMFMHY